MGAWIDSRRTGGRRTCISAAHWFLRLLVHYLGNVNAVQRALMRFTSAGKSRPVPSAVSTGYPSHCVSFQGAEAPHSSRPNAQPCLLYIPEQCPPFHPLQPDHSVLGIKLALNPSVCSVSHLPFHSTSRPLAFINAARHSSGSSSNISSLTLNRLFGSRSSPGLPSVESGADSRQRSWMRKLRV